MYIICNKKPVCIFLEIKKVRFERIINVTSGKKITGVQLAYACTNPKVVKDELLKSKSIYDSKKYKSCGYKTTTKLEGFCNVK